MGREKERETCEEREPQHPEPSWVIRLDEKAPPLVQNVFEAKGYREYDEDSDDPNQVWHVHWKGSRFTASEYKAANAAQRVNHFPKTTGITKKDCLLRNLRRMRACHGAIFNFFPESYLLPTEYGLLVQRCEALPQGERPIWIIKPTDSSQGRKIFLIQNLSEISYGYFAASMTANLLGEHESRDPNGDPGVDEKGRAISTALDMKTTLQMLKSRLNKTVAPCVKFTELHIVQRYIDRPLCFHGYKLDLRIYVLILSSQPLRIYWFNDCLLRFATHKYDLSDLENTYAHLTNTSINKNSTSHGLDKEGIGEGCKWSLQRFLREHLDSPLGSILLWARIKAIVNLTMLSVAAAIPDNAGGCFELLGFDVMVDENLRPWLLEVNCSPALGVECAADMEVKEPLVAGIVDLLDAQRATLPPRCRAPGDGTHGRASHRKSAGLAPLPAGGGVRAARARGSLKELADGRGRSGRRASETAADRIASLPASLSGFELIFPFNEATSKAAASVAGNESLIIGQVRTELQRSCTAQGAGSLESSGATAPSKNDTSPLSRTEHSMCAITPAGESLLQARSPREALSPGAVAQNTTIHNARTLTTGGARAWPANAAVRTHGGRKLTAQSLATY